MNTETQRLLESVMKLIAGQFGEKCEVVLHDWSNDYNETIVAIENGKVTGRSIGGSGSNLGLAVMRGTVDGASQLGYMTQTRDGRLLRSSTLYIEDEAGQKVGALCINYDVTDFAAFQKTLTQVMCCPVGAPGVEREFFSNDVNELLDYLIDEALRQVGKEPGSMSKEEKKRVVSFLDKKGALLVTKSGPKICQRLGISKFTLYNYLEEIHQEEQERN